MSLFPSKSVIFLIVVALISGCASPARIDSMVATDVDVPKSHPVPAALHNNIRVSSVLGGEETNPLWTSEIGNGEFRQALESSLENAGLLHVLRTGGRYELHATLTEVSQPMFGLDLTVKTRVHYRLVDVDSRKPLLDEEISESYTAKFSDHLMAFERLRLANEGSARKNISTLISKIISLDIQND